MEVPYPQELRIAGLGMLTVNLQVSDELQSGAGRWRALSDSGYTYVFQAIDLALARGQEWANQPTAAGASPSAAGNICVYANRYALIRDVSPLGGTNRGASGKEITVPQLKPAFDARYRRSRIRQTPQSDADGQGSSQVKYRLDHTLSSAIRGPKNGINFRATAKERSV